MVLFCLVYINSDLILFPEKDEFVFAHIIYSLILLVGPIRLIYSVFNHKINKIVVHVLGEYTSNYPFPSHESFKLLRKKKLFNWNIHGILFEGRTTCFESGEFIIQVREIIQGYYYPYSAISKGIGKGYYKGRRVTDHFLLREIKYRNDFTKEIHNQMEYIFHGLPSSNERYRKTEQIISMVFKFMGYFFLFVIVLIGVISLHRFLFLINNQILFLVLSILALCVLVLLFVYLAKKLIKQSESKVNVPSIDDLISKYPGGVNYRFLLEKLGPNIQITKHENKVYIKQQLLMDKLFSIGLWFSPSVLHQDILWYVSLIERMKKNVNKIYGKDK